MSQALKELVRMENGGAYAPGEFVRGFLRLWRDQGSGYRNAGLSDVDIVSALRSSGPAMLTVCRQVEPFIPARSSLKLYRGASSQRPNGVSWSDSFDVASSFALMKRERGSVAVAMVPPGALLGCIERKWNNEPPYYEYLIDTSQIEISHSLPVTDPKVIEGAIRDIEQHLAHNRYPHLRPHIEEWHQYALDLRSRLNNSPRADSPLA